MKRVVVDSSLAAKWRLPEADSEVAIALRAHWRSSKTQIIVPSWFSCEIANVFFRRRVKDEITHEESIIHQQQVLLDVTMREPDVALGSRAMDIAFRTRQSASYDAFYVALAEHLGCQLWTADWRFWNATHTLFPFVNWLGNVVISPPRGES